MLTANFSFVGRIKYYLILWIARLYVIYVNYFYAEYLYHYFWWYFSIPHGIISVLVSRYFRQVSYQSHNFGIVSTLVHSVFNIFNPLDNWFLMQEEFTTYLLLRTNSSGIYYSSFIRFSASPPTNVELLKPFNHWNVPLFKIHSSLCRFFQISYCYNFCKPFSYQNVQLFMLFLNCQLFQKFSFFPQKMYIEVSWKSSNPLQNSSPFNLFLSLMLWVLELLVMYSVFF